MAKSETPKTAKKQVARAKAPVTEEATAEVATPVTGSEAFYLKYLPAAQDLDARDVLTLGADPMTAYHNAVVGRDAVLAERASIDATGFRARWSEIETVDEIALATSYAHGLVESPKSSGETAALLVEAGPLRALLLSEARTRALETPKLAGEVRAIEKGGGPTDTAQDLIDLSTFFKKHKLVSAKGTATPARVARASELGTDLLKRLKPTGTKRAAKRTAAQTQAIDDCNRLWTLFATRYHHVACAGGARWGRAVIDQVPAPKTRLLKKSAKKPAKKSPPSPPTG